MNVLDYAIIAIFALFVMSGLYKGFIATALSIGAYIVACISGLLFRPLAAAAIVGHERLFAMMQYYTEGAEYIKDVEFSRMNVDAISSADLSRIIADAELPYPVGKEIAANIAKESFAKQNLSTLGEYFNQTMVYVFVNILAFLVVFLLVRAILGFVIHGVDYSYQLPSLRRHDAVIGGGVGFVRGVLALFLIFMLVPIALTVLPFDIVKAVVGNSFFAPFFYKSNFLLSLMPGV